MVCQPNTPNTRPSHGPRCILVQGIVSASLPRHFPPFSYRDRTYCCPSTLTQATMYFVIQAQGTMGKKNRFAIAVTVPLLMITHSTVGLLLRPS